MSVEPLGGGIIPLFGTKQSIMTTSQNNEGKSFGSIEEHFTGIISRMIASEFSKLEANFHSQLARNSPSNSQRSLPKRLLSVKEVSAMLGKSRSTLRRWEQDGLLLPMRVGAHKVMYKPEDIEQFISRHSALSGTIL